jgi:large subunit ribosomal protein L15
MPLQRRVPKFGFTNINRKEYEGVNLDTLQLLVDNGIVTDTVDMTTLQIVWLLKMKSLRF